MLSVILMSLKFEVQVDGAGGREAYTALNEWKKSFLLTIQFFFFFFKDLFIDWLITMLGLRFCARAFSSCGKRGPLFIAVRGPLTIAASLVAEHRLQTRKLSSYGSRAQLLRGMWDPPRPGLEPVSPALAGRLSTTVPPGKPYLSLLMWPLYILLQNSLCVN